MVTFLTGVPGSGKSYKAVFTIFNNFSDNEKAKKDLKKDFLNCYTNINEFKFDLVDNVFLLDMDDLKSKLKQLHKLYKSKANDEELIAKCKEFEIYKSLFVIDEAHNYFDNNDPVLIWWLSYHRHLYQDIMLITQNLSLIFSKYKSFSEFFYRAKSTTVSLDRNTFKYDVYINSRLAMNAKSHTEKLPKLQDVFELYQSGDSVGAPNILLRFYLFSAFFIFFVVVMAYFYFSSPDKEVDSNKTVKSAPPQKTLNTSFLNSAPVPKEPQKSDDFSQKKFFVLNCSASICVNDGVSIPPQLLRKFIASNDITSLYVYALSKSLTRHYLQSNEDFYTFLSQTKGFNHDAQTPATMFDDAPVTTR